MQKSFGAERTIGISYFGLLRWQPIAVLSTSCYMVVAFFPFDTQRCSIEIASLDLPSTAVNLTFLPTPINKGLHEKQGDWKLDKTTNESTLITEGNDTVYSLLKFGLVIERLPDHYFMIVIFPTILTAVLTFVTFFLPLKSGVRIGYILTVVLALVVLLTLFADTKPSAATYPSVLGKIIVFCIHACTIIPVVCINKSDSGVITVLSFN